jgi:hypothetical protein
MGCKKKKGKKRFLALGSLAILALLLAGGCDGQVPVKPPAPTSALAPTAEKQKSIIEQMQDRKPVAQLKKDELPAREEENKAVSEVADSDQENVETRKREETVNSIKAWCFWIEIGAIVLAIVAAALILKFSGNVKLALTVAGAGALIAVLAYCVGWVLAHLGLVGIMAGVVVVLIILYKVWEHYDELRDFAKVTADKVNDAGQFTEQLSKAKVLNAEMFNKVLSKLKG